MANKSITEQISTYLTKRKTAPTSQEIARGIKANANTVRRILGSSFTVMESRKKCAVSGGMAHTYAV